MAQKQQKPEQKKALQPQSIMPHMLAAMCGILAGVLLSFGLYSVNNSQLFELSYHADADGITASSSLSEPQPLPEPKLDKEAYARKLLAIANNGLLQKLEDSQVGTTSSSMLHASSSVQHGSSTASTTVHTKPLTAQELASTTDKLWPAKAVYPNPGALLPFNRIVAYYGNFYSTKMGALGENPPEIMKKNLMAEVRKWEAADPDTPVIPAIDYIAMTAQGSAGADGMYRFRMPSDQVQKAIDLAQDVNGIVILEVQVGLSDLQNEIETLEPYLKQPEVHLAIDPEFHMVTGAAPGTVIGTVDAKEVNAAAQYLAKLVRENDLPPKILIVHRFTIPMVTHTMDIKPLPEVQVVMDMDGWGTPARKYGTYRQAIVPYPVQFTGFKLFYKNDIKPPSTHMLTPQEVLQLSPQPSFIQYQ